MSYSSTILKVSSWRLSSVITLGVSLSLQFQHTHTHTHTRHNEQSLFFFLTFGFIYFIYLFMAVLGLCFCVRAFSSCGKWGPLFIVVRGPLIIAASLVVAHKLQTRRLSNCGSRT